MANLTHSVTSPSETQAVLSGEIQFADSGCTSEERTPSSNHLNPHEEASISHEENRGEKSPAPQARFLRILKMLKAQWANFPIARVEQKVGNELEQVMPSKTKPHEMDHIMRSLSSSVRRHFRVGGRWQEIQGCCRWDGLIDPLDPGLRAEIFRYGEFARATYDALDRQPHTRNYGCKFTERELLSKAGMDYRGYQITQFLYATTRLRLPKLLSEVEDVDYWINSNWIGFVAVCTSRDEIERLGRRDIVVAWRGTVTRCEWIKDLQIWLNPYKLNPQNAGEDVMVESGFMSMYSSSNEESPFGENSKRSAKEQVLRAVEDLVEKYQHEKNNLSITITGHSLGSALATLCSYDIAKSDWINRPPALTSPSGAPELDRIGSAGSVSAKTFPTNRIPITVYSFAGPRVGNQAFKNKLEELGVAVLRVVRRHDMVPKLPMEILSSYTHVGVKVDIDNFPCDYETETHAKATGEITDASPTETQESAEPNPMHAHTYDQNGGIEFMLNPWMYFVKQHRLREMLARMSPAHVEGFTNMEKARQERWSRKRLLRQAMKAPYHGATFVLHVQSSKRDRATSAELEKEVTVSRSYKR